MSDPASDAVVGDDFDDHLGLAAMDFAEVRLIVFHGASGSGKSTYLNRLLRAHPSFCNRPADVIGGGTIDWRAVRNPASELVVVEELLANREIVEIAKLLRAGHLVMAASHLHPWITGLLGMSWPTLQFATDRDPLKIERLLARRGLHYTPKTVAAFCKIHGATFTDVDIVLEHCGGRDFDRAFSRFQRYCTIERRPV